MKKIIFGLSLMLAIGGLRGMRAQAETDYFFEEEYNGRSSTWDWAESAIHWAYAEGITAGTGEGYFRPDNEITRAEAVTMLAKFKELDTSGYNVDSTVFNDVNGAWYTQYVNAAYENHIVSGKEEGRFDPHGKLTRAEAATILVKTMGYTLRDDVETGFQDIADKWYTNYVGTAYANGLVSGKATDRFDPETGITRAELVMIMYKAAMKEYQAGEKYAVIISDEQESFTLTADSDTLFVYDAETQTVVGDVAVKMKDGYKLVYFSASDSVEVTPKEGELSYMRIFSNGGDIDVYGNNLEKVKLDSDRSVTLYCKDKEKNSAEALITVSRLYLFTIADQEGQEYSFTTEGESGDSSYNVYREISGTLLGGIDISHERSDYFKVTPTDDSTFAVYAAL
ncbi:MAG: S-layer homology domain-containing protein [Lachnospiraceae bacterium]|nr:S-layer homology domain-containing protein [Lachnospiraceae bacterium]